MFVSTRFWLIEHKQKILLWFVLVLVATLSFGVGYLMAREANQTPIVIEQCAQSAGEE